MTTKELATEMKKMQETMAAQALLIEDQAQKLTAANQLSLQRKELSRVYQTGKNKTSQYWGTGVATETIKKGEKISLTLYDAPNSNKTSAEFPQGKEAYNFKVRLHTPYNGEQAGAVLPDENPRMTEDEIDEATAAREMDRLRTENE